MHIRRAGLLIVLASLIAACKSDPADPGPSTRNVTVTKTGNGAGTVTSSPAGINCGATCAGTLAASGQITFTAAAGANSNFVSWGGACSGTTASCSAPAGTTALSVSARFDLVLRALTVTLAGTGGGSVASTAPGINCGGDCTEDYPHGASVTLSATPNASSAFAGWTGACTGTGQCVVTMNQVQNVTATFTLVTHNLTVTLAGTGTGTVTSTSAGINCGGDCSETYNQATIVTLNAAAGAASVFAGWSGACTGTGQCVVTMSQAQNVTATFNIATHVLTITPAGTGTGTVTSNPAGINCPTDCTEAYNSGTSVTITAAAAVGSTFAGWTGGTCGGTNPCSVNMTTARTVTATFTAITPALTVVVTGGGTGTVTSVGAGINCGVDCSENYPFANMVTLNAAAGASSTFIGWGGACTGTGQCVVTMDQARTVAAVFDAVEARFPDSQTRFCSTGAAAIACPGGPAGQDGHYEINVPSYTVVGDWVADVASGLVWERNPPTTGISQAAAITYCGDLVIDGFSDWRLPTYLEWVTLFNLGVTVPPFSTAAFPGIPQATAYWTSTDRATNNAQAFIIGTNYATTTYANKTETNRLVRCVRGAPFAGTLSVAAGSVTDARTKLVWQSATSGMDMSWADALAYCEALVLDGNPNWRLPNAKELQSIVDPAQVPPTISPLFAVRPATRFWSSTPLPFNPAGGYVIDFGTGVSDGIETPVEMLRAVRCVR